MTVLIARLVTLYALVGAWRSRGREMSTYERLLAELSPEFRVGIPADMVAAMAAELDRMYEILTGAVGKARVDARPSDEWIASVAHQRWPA